MVWRVDVLWVRSGGFSLVGAVISAHIGGLPLASDRVSRWLDTLTPIAWRFLSVGCECRMYDRSLWAAVQRRVGISTVPSFVSMLGARVIGQSS